MKTIFLSLLLSINIFSQCDFMLLLSGEIVDDTLALLGDGNTVGWYKSTYLTKNANNKVTSWTDTTGLGHHLLQADTSKAPTSGVDGVKFDAVNDYMKTAAFTLNQPVTIYAVVRQDSWTTGDAIWDGNTYQSMGLYQSVGTPTVRLFAGGTTVYVAGLEVGSYGVVTAVYNGTSATLQINNNTADTGTSGTNNGGGFTLGARDTGADFFGDISVKEIIIRKTADDATNQNLIKTYLNQKYSVY